jgi:hypothetical protein
MVEVQVREDDVAHVARIATERLDPGQRGLMA